MGKKNITLNNLSTAIEDLARMVKTGFDENGKQHGRIENRLTAVEQRLDNMDLRLGQFAFSIDVQELKKEMELLKKRCYAKN